MRIRLFARFAAPVVTSILLVGGLGTVPARAVVNPSGVWHAPQAVLHNVDEEIGDSAYMTAISCPSAGNCGAVGYFDGTLVRNGPVVQQGIVASETDGTWTTAKPVSASDVDPYNFTAISCASAGNCTAVGNFEDNLAFGVTETSGVWGGPQTLAGAADVTADLTSVSCPAAGFCTAAGSLQSSAIVIIQTSDNWGSAVAPPGALNTDAGFTSISCAAIGFCSVGGFYDSSPLPGAGYVLVDTESSDTWGTVQDVNGSFNNTPSIDVDTITSVSCSSAGNCSAGGFYGAFQSASHAFVISQTGGTWADVKEVGGTLDKGGSGITSISCRTTGNCSAGGYYVDGQADSRAMVINEVGGTWKADQQVAGSLNLETGEIYSVSCASAGNCSAAGFYTNKSEGFDGLVVTETKGVWGSGQDVANPAVKDGEAQLKSISCPAVGSCGAAGHLFDAAGFEQAIVNRETPATVPGPPTHVVAVAANRAVTVRWTAPANDGGTPITGYIVTSKPGGKTCTTTTTRCTIKDLTDGTSYTFSVVAVNVMGKSVPAVSKAALLKGAPGAPTQPKVRASSTTAIAVTWKAPVSDGGAAITGYDVYVGTKSGKESAKPVNPKLVSHTKHSYTVTGLKKLTRYYFVVRAKNSVGVGAASKQVSAIA